MVVSYFSAFGAGFNWKEKSYITISGFPKATVQVSKMIHSKTFFIFGFHIWIHLMYFEVEFIYDKDIPDFFDQL